MSKQAILLLNLGTPDSTSVADVRRYLREFLMDKRVINLPYPLRWALINLIIAPTRAKNSAEAYSRIWTEKGSPLLTCGRELQGLVGEGLDMPVALGMRYGNPSTPDAVRELYEKGAQDIFIIPLYPHYAMSSYETAILAAREAADALNPELRLTVMPPYYQETDYLGALEAVARPYLEKPHDLVLFSYHGIPEEHLRITDPTSMHCLRCETCCDTPNPAHATCYRHQCFTTTHRFCERAGIPPERYRISFQSRLGKDPWLKPYTDFVLEDLPKEGVKKLLVMCPAFVADNLETLEEIAIEGRETFLEAGGESFELIPCLNTTPEWVSFLRQNITAWQTR